MENVVSGTFPISSFDASSPMPVWDGSPIQKGVKTSWSDLSPTTSLWDFPLFALTWEQVELGAWASVVRPISPACSNLLVLRGAVSTRVTGHDGSVLVLDAVEGECSPDGISLPEGTRIAAIASGGDVSWVRIVAPIPPSELF